MTVWSTYWTNSALVVISAALIVIFINDCLHIFPMLVKGLGQWKVHREIEHNIPIARTRNILLAIFSIPLCLIADRYSLYHPALLDKVPPLWSVFATAGAYILYRLLRLLTFSRLRFPKLHPEERMAIHHIFDDLLIALTALMLASVGIMLIIKVSDYAAKIVLLVEAGLAFFIVCIQIYQFLAVQHSRLSTILYLCALEILPLAAMVALQAIF